MNPTEVIEILEAYNKVSDYLFGTAFNLEVLSNPEIGRMSHENGKTTFTQINDYEEELNAFGMKYRLLLQPKDRISLDRIYKLYQLPFVPANLLNAFSDMWKKTDDLMAKRLIGTWDGAPESYAKLHQIIMYGELAHQNDDKVKLYDQIEKHYRTSWLAWSQFALAINWNMTLIQGVQKLNEKLIAHLAPATPRRP